MKGFPKQDSGPKILAADSLIAERYSVVDVIGQGGMGVVYRARDINSDRVVAVKMVLRSNISQDQRRFEREAKAASLLNHPNVIAIHDFGLEGDQAYLCMDLLEGRNLDEIVEKKPLNLNQFRHIFSQACSGLQHAHDKGIVHRDLKPGNLMIVERDGDKDSVIILDFGLVKLMDGESDPDQKLTKLTRTNALLGSPLYMSPEQCRSLDLDHRTDIYSLGCVMYEALTGSPPLVANTLLDVMNKHLSETPRPMREALPGLYVPAALERAIFHAMAKNQDDRPVSMDELAKEIEGAFSGAPDVILAGQPSSKISLDAATKANKQSINKRKKNSTGPWVYLGIGAAVCLLPLGIFLGVSFHKDSGGNQVQTSQNLEVVDSKAPEPGQPAVPVSSTLVPSRRYDAEKSLPKGTVVPGVTSIPGVMPGATPVAASTVPSTTSIGGQPLPVTQPVAGMPPGAAMPGSLISGPGSSISTPSSIVGGLSKSNSPDKSLNDANFSFRAGDYAQARNQYEAVLALNVSGDKQISILGKLVICASKTQDLNACQEYLEKFKDLFPFHSASAGDATLLYQIYEMQRHMSDKEDYSFSEKLLRASLDDFYRHNSRADKHAVRMKMELSRVFADQNRDSEAASILQEVINDSDQYPDMASEAKMHLARVQGGPPGGGGSGPPAGGPGGFDPRRPPPGMEGGGPFGGPPGGGPPGGGPPGR